MKFLSFLGHMVLGTFAMVFGALFSIYEIFKG